jgi:zinc protease
MRKLHAASVVACRARISMVGAVTRAQADAIATRLLARLPQVPCASLPPLAAGARSRAAGPGG